MTVANRASVVVLAVVFVLAATPNADAVLVRNITDGTTLFFDDFENGTVNSPPGTNDPDVGTWTATPSGGSSLLEIRDTVPYTASQGDQFVYTMADGSQRPALQANFAAVGGGGDLIQLDYMLKINTHGGGLRLNNDSTKRVFFNNGSIVNVNIEGAPFPTLAPTGNWDRVSVRHTNGTKGVSISINGSPYETKDASVAFDLTGFAYKAETDHAAFGIDAVDYAPERKFFTEDFSDNSPGPNMVLGPAYGSPTPDFSGGDFSLGPAADSNRIYLGTNGRDYSSVPFLFEATVTMSGQENNGYASPFFGMGTLAPDGGNYGEPASPRLLMQVGTFENDPLYGLESRDNSARVTEVNQVALAHGTHRLRMLWHPATQIAIFKIDKDFAGGAFVSDFSFSLDGSDNGFDSTNSQLILGGGYPVRFDDISVIAIPEPSATVLLLFGLFGLVGLARRWRK